MARVEASATKQWGGGPAAESTRRHGDVAAGEAVERAGREDEQEREGEREGPEHPALDVDHLPVREEEGRGEHEPGREGARLADEQYAAAADAVAEPPEPRGADELEGGVGRPDDPVDDLVAAEVEDDDDSERMGRGPRSRARSTIDNPSAPTNWMSRMGRSSRKERGRVGTG